VRERSNIEKSYSASAGFMVSLGAVAFLEAMKHGTRKRTNFPVIFQWKE